MTKGHAMRLPSEIIHEMAGIEFEDDVWRAMASYYTLFDELTRGLFANGRNPSARELLAVRNCLALNDHMPLEPFELEHRACDAFLNDWQEIDSPGRTLKDCERHLAEWELIHGPLTEERIARRIRELRMLLPSRE
jgi:hypothetical protein